MDAKGNFLELQGTAEGKPFSRPDLKKMLEVAEPGISNLLAAQIGVLQKQA